MDWASQDDRDADWSPASDDRYAGGQGRTGRHGSGRDGSGRRGVSRWGRGGDEQASRSAQRASDDWQSAEQPPAWSGGADELEPLPPLEDAGRRRAWQSAEDSDWGRLGDEEDADPRWAAPLPEFEPEYEGDTW